MTPLRRVTVLLALAFVGTVLSPSCSFVISGPPDPYRPEEPPRCQTSRLAPTADAVGAGVFATLGTSIFLFESSCNDPNNANCPTTGERAKVGAVLFVPAAFYTIAAVVGYNKTGRCREAGRQHRAFMMQSWQARGLPAAGR